MKTATIIKPQEKKSGLDLSKPSLKRSPSPENEVGAPAGMPLFLQGSATATAWPRLVAQQRAIDVGGSSSLADGIGAPAGMPMFLRGAVSSAIMGTPSRKVASPDGGEPVDVYDTTPAHQAANRMGAFGFSYRDSIFLGQDPGIPGAPTSFSGDGERLSEGLDESRPLFFS